MRYMCLNCGEFFSMEYKYEAGKSVCPHCGDMYWVDNCLPDVPPPVEFDQGPSREHHLKFVCGHEFYMEFPEDAHYCPICGAEHFYDVVYGFTLKDYQEQILQELGL